MKRWGWWTHPSVAWHIRTCVFVARGAASQSSRPPAAPAWLPQGARHGRAETLVPALHLLLVELRYQSLDVRQLAVQVLTPVLLLAVVRISLFNFAILFKYLIVD